MNLGILARHKDNNLYLNRSYINYFRNLGFNPKIIIDSTNLDEFDIFVIPGGYDLNPKYYHEDNISSSNIDNYNDSMDLMIIDYAVKNNKILLGICRGIQSINVYFGGSLKQDISNHKNNNHFIIAYNKLILVNSYHHQSINRLGNDLLIKGKGLDNEIEIIKYKKIIGVQFHPELMNTPIINNLILKLINEA